MANKKVIDIYPPKKDKKQILEINNPAPKTAVFPKKGLILSLFFLILLGILCYFNLSKVEIEIWPETEIVKAESEALFSAKPFNKEKTVIESFSSSGKVLKEGKAEGLIRVYNEYSTSSQILIASTRFVSADGKVFRTPVSVTIPGGRYEGGKFIRGEADVGVVADESGQEYNINASTFSIPGFAGTDRYTKFYGESFQPMQGGFKEEVSVVTEEDLSQAEENLIKRATEECKLSLEEELRSEEISANFDYFPKDFHSEIIEKLPLALPGEEAEEFKFQVRVICETLLVEKEDLDNFAKELIVQPVKQLYKESLKIDYSLKSVDWEKEEIMLFLSVSAKIYSEINMSDLKKSLSEKSLLEAKMFLDNQPEFIENTVSFWPFWVNKVPDDPNKIKVDIKID